LSIYQLNNCHGSSITRTVSEAQNPCVPSLSFSEARGDLIEQLLHDCIALYHLESPSAGMEVPALA
jgi:hypothetical protein